MSLDMYIDRIEIKPVTEEVCHWRNNRKLFDFIKHNLFPYGEDEYSKKRELTVNDLIAIKKFLENQAKETGYWNNQLSMVNQAIGELSAGDGSVKYHFSADW